MIPAASVKNAYAGLTFTFAALILVAPIVYAAFQSKCTEQPDEDEIPPDWQPIETSLELKLLTHRTRSPRITQGQPDSQARASSAGVRLGLPRGVSRDRRGGWPRLDHLPHAGPILTEKTMPSFSIHLIQVHGVHAILFVVYFWQAMGFGGRSGLARPSRRTYRTIADSKGTGGLRRSADSARPTPLVTTIGTSATTSSTTLLPAIQHPPQPRPLALLASLVEHLHQL